MSGCSSLLAQVVGFTETFSGEGSYASGSRTGFEIPGWYANGDGYFAGDGTYRVENSASYSDECACFYGSSDELRHFIDGRGSFRMFMEFQNIELGWSMPSMLMYDGSLGTIAAGVNMNDGVSGSLIYVQHLEPNELGTIHGFFADGTTFQQRRVELGTDLSIQFSFDLALKEMSYHVSTGGSEYTFGPKHVPEDGMTDESFLHLGFDIDYGGIANGNIDMIRVEPVAFVRGDFTLDEIVNAADIDRLSNAIATNYQNVGFDLNGDSEITKSDRTVLIQDILNTYFGDSNLDGEFNSADLVNIFAAGEYEDAIEGNSTWSTGDWSGNGEFDSADLVLAFQDGGYELGPREAVRSVPEPNASGVAASFGFLIGSLVRRRQR